MNIPDFEFTDETLKRVKEIIKQHLTIESYSIFIEPLKLLGVSNDIIKLQTSFDSHLVTLNRKYKELFEKIVKDFTNYMYEIEFLSDKDSSSSSADDEDNELSNLNEEYTFETFVEGENNSIALRAAKVIAGYTDNLSSENKKIMYNLNICFIYGGVGLGKTHLLQAIGNYIKKNDPSKKVIYLSSEQFYNEVTSHFVKGDKAKREVQERLRNCDVLLIDDIQFFKNKDYTQTEMFNTFNALYEKNKKIVFTSDKKPADLGELDGIEERLLTRFTKGVVTDIHPPDYETRMAIINKKLEKVNLHFSFEVKETIALAMKDNIREIEGCLNSITFFCIMTNSVPTVKMAEEHIKRIKNESNPRKINIYDIKNAVANYYSIPVENFDKRLRTKDVAFARQVAMYLSRTETDNSLPKIGDEFGGRDHSTVSSAIKKISDLLRVNDDLSRDLENIKEELKLK